MWQLLIFNYSQDVYKYIYKVIYKSSNNSYWSYEDVHANWAFVDMFADGVQVSNKDQLGPFVLFLNIKVSSRTNAFAKCTCICFMLFLCRQWAVCRNMTVNCSQVLDNGTYYELLCASSAICCTGSVNTCSSSACSENSVAASSESSELPVL